MISKKSWLYGLGLSVALFGCVNQKYLNSVKLEGFPHDYVPLEISIPTEGNIVEIERLAGQKYDSTHYDDGCLEFSGKFGYKISPSKNFSSPFEEDNNWYGERNGTVLLKAKDKLTKFDLEHKINK